MAMVRNVDVTLGQTLKHSVHNYVILCNAILCKVFNFLLNNVREVGRLVISRFALCKKYYNATSINN
jgi:hypothetical protein